MELPLFSSAGPARSVAAHGILGWRPVRLVLTATQKWVLPLGVLAFYTFFWERELGVNMALYTLLGVTALLASRPRAAWRSTYFRLVLAGAVLSAGAIVYYGSAAAFLACMVSGIMLFGFANQPLLKLAPLALLTGMLSAGQVLLGLPGALVRSYLPSRETKAGRTLWYARLLLVPVLVLAVFHVLFLLANPRYSALVNRAWAPIGEGLLVLLNMLANTPVLFWVFATAATAVLLLRVPVPLLAQLEAHFGEYVRRRRDGVASFAVRNPDFRNRSFRVTDLRREYLAALAVFGLVNLLLLAVNVIDVQWLWFGFRPEPGFNLAQFVHEGTYVLIFSILLAMGIVLWFFRRNLNFYQPGLPALRWGATVWVLQNAVLAVSVGLRNYYYIEQHGLAYKRIGVCFFLLLTLFGLFTILRKIWQRRSAYSLVRQNSIAAYLVLLALALGNWETWIIHYNLTSNLRQIDYGFLRDMPGRALPELLRHRAALNRIEHLAIEDGYRYDEVQPEAAQRMLDERVKRWKERYQKEVGWQDWTYANWAAYRALNQDVTLSRVASKPISD